MLFPTTIILALLATVTPVLSLPLAETRNDLVTRSDEASLEARDIGLDLSMDMMEKRDAELYEDLFARDADLYDELVARSPEPEMEVMERRGKFGALFKIGKGIGKLFHHGGGGNNNNNQQNQKRSPEPEPEIEDVERRGKLGFLVKIGKGIAKLFHHGSKANNNNNQQQQQQHRKRSKIGNFFKKVWGGIKKVGKAVVGAVLRREEAVVAPALTRRGGAQIDNLEARNFEMDKRSKIGNFFKKVWGGIKKVGKAVVGAVLRREESAPLEARSFDDAELETRSFEDDEY